MIVNNTEYGYTIEPFFDKVRVEIYKVSKPLATASGNKVHLHLMDKAFGAWYRKPTKEDYVDAKEWAEDQMMCIYHANK